ncbi:unnamed protein product, partial [marine sediment metagenome]
DSKVECIRNEKIKKMYKFLFKNNILLIEGSPYFRIL